MQQKKSINFGARGWILILWVATAMFSYVVAGNYPLNIMSAFGYWGENSTLSIIYTGASIVGIIVQVIFSRKIRAWKKLSVILGIATLVFLGLEMLLPPGIPWLISFGIATAISALYGTWAMSVLVGVWFPRRKGTVMGIITFAFPIGNALLGGFMSRLGGAFGNGATPQAAALEALWPYVAVVLVGFIIGVIFISEFPEQVGAYRDNDKSLTPEIANEMMRQEIENRKSTVWTPGHTLKSPDFWLITVPMGLLLMFAIGAMTQSMNAINHYAGDGGLIDKVGGYNNVMLFIAGAGIVGSYVFGLIDTKFGTRKAVLFSHVLMLVSAILGVFDNGSMAFIALIILGLFMGASSNYTVSSAVQYWRIEDFPSVFSVVNPVANFINAFGPFLVTALLGSNDAKLANVSAMFIASGVAAIISIICCLLFKPSRVKETDDKYRLAAGKPLDDVLVGRK